jgi:hypothetical protein
MKRGFVWLTFPVNQNGLAPISGFGYRYPRVLKYACDLKSYSIIAAPVRKKWPGSLSALPLWFLPGMPGQCQVG